MSTRSLVPRHKEAGFTLTELMVVIAIIGILAAIAVPSYIGAKRNGQNSRAQAVARSALAAERTYYVDYQVYLASDTAANRTALGKIESNVNWTTTNAESDGAMAAVAAAGQVVVVVSTSKSGDQFCIMNIAADQGTAVNGQTAAGTYYAQKSGVTTPPTSVATTQCNPSTYSRTTGGW